MSARQLKALEDEIEALSNELGKARAKNDIQVQLICSSGQRQISAHEELDFSLLTKIKMIILAILTTQLIPNSLRNVERMYFLSLELKRNDNNSRKPNGLLTNGHESGRIVF